MKNYSLNLINRGFGPGFSELSFPVKTGSTNKFLFDCITLLFSILAARIAKDNHLFILAKYQYQNGSINVVDDIKVKSFN